MQKKSSLLGGVALGAVLAAAMGSTAEAKTHHHHAASAGGNSALAAKVDTLTAAVSDLEARLNDEAQARQQLAADAAAARADAAAARAQAADAQGQLQAQIQTIPGAVSTAVAANKPKPNWSDTTHIGGTVFADISHISQTPSPNKINGTGADIKRAYVSIDHTFNNVYSANLTFDLAPNGIILSGGTYGTGTLQGSEAVKYAYVQGHYSDAFIVQVGAAKTPWIPFVEDIYGYRYIDKVLIDQNKFGNSSDWGANVHGDLGHGLFDYSVSVLDGAGYKNPVRSTTPDVEGRVNFNYHGLVAAAGGYYGREAADIQGGAPNQAVSRYNFLLAYTNSHFRIGGEWFQANNWKTAAGTAAIAAVAPTTVTGPCTIGGVMETCTTTVNLGSAAVPAVPAKPDQAQGYSVFASYNFTPKWSIFGRYDGLSPSQKLAPLERYQYFNVGVGYEPVKTVDLALVYKHEHIDHAAKGGYSDGTTVLAPSSTGVGNAVANYDEVGLFAQFKF